MPTTVYDLLSPAGRAKYTPDVMTDRGRALLAMPVPDHFDEGTRRAIGQQVEGSLASFTQVHAATNRWRRAMGGDPFAGAPAKTADLLAGGMQADTLGMTPGGTPFGRLRDPNTGAVSTFKGPAATAITTDPADINRQKIAQIRAKGPIKAAGAYAGKALAEDIGGAFDTRPASMRAREQVLPQARDVGTAARVGELAGGVGSFALKAELAAGALAPTMGAAAAGALSAGAAAAASPGTPVERGIAAATTGAAAGASGALAGRLAGAATSRLGRAAAFAGGQVGSAAAFGVAQPEAARAATSALSGPGVPDAIRQEKPGPITVDDRARSFGEMLAVGLLTHAAGVPFRGRETPPSPLERPAARLLAERAQPHPDDVFYKAQQALASDPELASRARGPLEAAQMNQQAPAVPPGQENMIPIGEQATRQAKAVLARVQAGGAPLRFTLPDGRVLENANLADVRVFPWAENGVRAVVVDRATGDIHPLQYPDLGRLNEAWEATQPWRPATIKTADTTPAREVATRVQQIDGRLEALEKSRPQQSDKEFSRWQRRHDKLSAERDRLVGTPGGARAARTGQIAPIRGSEPVARPEKPAKAVPDQKKRTGNEDKANVGAFGATPERKIPKPAEAKPIPAAKQERYVASMAEGHVSTHGKLETDMQSRFASRLEQQAADASADPLERRAAQVALERIRAPKDSGRQGGPGESPGTGRKAPPPAAPEEPAAKRPRSIVDMPVTSLDSAKKLTDGLNRKNPDLEARIVSRGKGLAIEVNSDAKEPARPAPKPEAPQRPKVEPAAAPAPEVKAGPASAGEQGTEAIEPPRGPAVAPGKPLEQEKLAGMPAPEALAGKGPAPTPEGNAAVAAMGGEAKSFEEHFRDAQRSPDNRGSSPEEIAAEAARMAGMKEPPEGFDAAAEFRSNVRRALEEQGQQSMFGELDTSSKPREEAPVAAAPEAAPLPDKGAVVDESTRVTPIEGGIDSSELKTVPERFQNRFETIEGGTNAQKIQGMLREHGGKYDPSELAASPLIVWADKGGEMGPEGQKYVIDGHHRFEVGTHEWTESEGRHVPTGTVSRKFPAVEFHGTLADAQQYAKDVNRRATPNTYLENAVRARELADAGETTRAIADKLKVSTQRIKGMIDLSHVDRGVLQAMFPEGVKQSFYAYGEAVGRAVKEFPDYYSPEHQRSLLQAVGRGDFTSHDSFEQAIETTLAGLRMARQTDVFGDLGEKIFTGMTPDQISRTTARAFNEISRTARSLEASIKEVKKLGKLPGAEEAARALAKAVQPDVDRAKALQEKFTPKAIMERIYDGVRRGVPVADVLEGLRAEADKLLGPEGPHDRTGESGFVTIETLLAPYTLAREAARFIYRQALENIPRAQELLRRRAGADAFKIRIAGPGGTTARVEDVQYKFDPLTDFSHYRIAALLDNMLTRGKSAGLGGIVLPPELRLAWINMTTTQARLLKRAIEARHAVLGDEGIKYLAAWYPGAREMSRASEGKPNRLPRTMQPMIGARRAWLESMFDEMGDHIEANGGQRPKKRENYTPHNTIGDFSVPFTDQLRLIFGDRLSPEQMRDATNRHLEHREGDRDYVEDSTIQDYLYAIRYSRFLSSSPFLRTAHEWIRSNEAADPLRAEMVRQFIQGTMFEKQGVAESVMNNVLRALTMKEQSSDLRSIPTADFHAEAAKHGVAQPVVRAYSVRAGDKVRWTEGKMAGSDKVVRLPATDGRVLIGVTDGHLLGMNRPQLKAPFEAVRNLMSSGGLGQDLKLRLKQKMGLLDPRWSWDEHKSALEAKRLADLAHATHDPWNLMFSVLGRQQVRSLIGYNSRAITQNSFNNLLTSIPEYGAGPVAQAIGTGMKVGPQQALRNVVDALEGVGWLKPEQAASWRHGIPAFGWNPETVHPAEARSAAIGSQQAEVPRTQEDALRGMSGAAEWYRKLAEVVSPLAPYRVIEDVTRGIDAASSVIVAQRLGLKPESLAAHYEATRAGRLQLWEDLSKHLEDTSTATAFAAQMYPVTMFDYGPLGQDTMMRKGFGSLIFRLSTFAKNYMLHYELRPIAGAAAISGATMRGVLRTATGGRLGNKAPGTTFDSRGFVPRSQYPTPAQEYAGAKFAREQRQALAEWLEQGGAGFAQRQAARVFVRQLVVTGALLGASELTNNNWLVAGMPSYHLLLMMMLRSLLPQHREKLNKWIQQGTRAAVWNLGRGAVPVGPIADIAQQEVRGVAGELKKREGAAAKEGRVFGPKDWAESVAAGAMPGAAEFGRQLSGAPIIQIRRGVQINPELFDAHPWVYDALGVHSVYQGLTPDEKMKYLTGRLPIAREMESRRTLHPKRPPARYARTVQ